MIQTKEQQQKMSQKHTLEYILYIAMHIIYPSRMFLTYKEIATIKLNGIIKENFINEETAF